MQHPDQPLIQINSARIKIQHFPSALTIEAECQRIDCEVAPLHVLADSGASDSGQRCRPRIDLTARHHKIQVGPSASSAKVWRQAPLGSAKAPMRRDAPAALRCHRLRQTNCVTLHHKVNLAPSATKH